MFDLEYGQRKTKLALFNPLFDDVKTTKQFLYQFDSHFQYSICPAQNEEKIYASCMVSMGLLSFTSHTSSRVW